LQRNAAATYNNAEIVINPLSNIGIRQSPLGEVAKLGRAERVLSGRDGLKKFRMPQTTQ
jgi:hypothetical protein